MKKEIYILKCTYVFVCVCARAHTQMKLCSKAFRQKEKMIKINWTLDDCISKATPSLRGVQTVLRNMLSRRLRNVKEKLVRQLL